MYLDRRTERSLSAMGNDFCLLLYPGEFEMDAVDKGKS